jgi:molybdate transport system ATP-binding protein
MSMLALGVEKRLGEFFLAAGFEAAGGVTALFGASGAGKTTLVNMIAGLIAPDRGRIRLDDTVLFDSTARIDVPAHRRRIGYVFQEGRLFPHLSVAANLDYGRACAALRATARKWRGSSTCSTSATCSIGGPESFPAANANASPSAARY